MERLARLVLSLFFLGGPPSAFAEAPRVAFDMPFAVACRDVTPADYPAAHPGYKLVEAKLEISSLLTAGQEKDLTQYFIRVEIPQGAAAGFPGATAGLSSRGAARADESRIAPFIVDYLPKTQHEALASKVTSEKSTERAAALGINLSGKYELLTMPGPSAGLGQKKSSSVKTELLPPLETVAASGTLSRGSSLFFKIKSTPRNLLEGTRDYALVLRVPAAWRADYVRVHCEAEGIRRGVVSTFDEELSCGQRDFLVALYQDGDETARQIAENFARREAAKQGQGPGTREAGRSKVQGRTGDAAAYWPLNASPWAAIHR
jgi:hypothetical protein